MLFQMHQKKWGWIFSVSAVVLTVSIAWLEQDFSYRFRFSLLYFIPILIVTRIWGTRVGVAAAVACSIITLSMELLSDRSYGLWVVPYVNGLMMLVVYVGAVLLDGQYRHESQMARTDGLTGLLNRKAFFELLDFEVDRCRRYHRPVSIAYVDVDDFKMINDRYGHGTGDRFLMTLAKTLNKGSRSTDKVARLGGDEFAILMPETDEVGAKVVLDRLNALAQIMNKHLFSITLSIGVATFHKAPETAEAMISEADRLMYLSKKKGKNRIETHSIR